MGDGSRVTAPPLDLMSSVVLHAFKRQAFCN